MEWIKNNLPIISVYLITLGIVRLTAYYSYFGINVASYLDLSEIVQLQFSYFAGIVCIVLFANAATVRKFGFVLETDKEDIYRELLKPKKHQQDKAFQTISNYGKVGTTTLVVSMCLMYVFIFIYKANTKHFISYPSIEMFVITLISYAFIINAFKYGRILQTFGLPEKKTITNITIGVAVIISFAVTFGFSRNDAFDLIVKRSENEVTLNFENKIITTTDTLVFVGKTKNYAFLYNRFTGQSEVYPFSEIKSIQYRPSKEYKTIPYAYRIGR